MTLALTRLSPAKTGARMTLEQELQRIRDEGPGPIMEKQDCVWTRSEYPDGGIVWQTECGQIHEFMNDGPIENSHNFCPYCGRFLIS